MRIGDQCKALGGSAVGAAVYPMPGGCRLEWVEGRGLHGRDSPSGRLSAVLPELRQSYVAQFQGVKSRVSALLQNGHNSLKVLNSCSPAPDYVFDHDSYGLRSYGAALRSMHGYAIFLEIATWK